MTHHIVFILFIILHIMFRRICSFNNSEFAPRRRLYTTSVTKNYVSAAPQTFTVPPAVYSLYIEAYGAGSGTNTNGGSQGQGAKVASTFSVTPGTVLNLYIGSKGTNNNVQTSSPGGYNGGGNGKYGCGGGGATDVRSGGSALSHRILVAGGGGGPHDHGCPGSNGGHGGNPNGKAGTRGSSCDTGADPGFGGGGTASAGGTSPCGVGSLGQGGNVANPAGGGGGGYYGGGAGCRAGGGGGGSSYSTGTGTTYNTPANTGDGYIIISYDLIPTYQPSIVPSIKPSTIPTIQPSIQPSVKPTTTLPTVVPSLIPTVKPSTIPTCLPSQLPSIKPSFVPTSQPSMQPSGQPIGQPSRQPSQQPSAKPSRQPTSQPTEQPSRQPTQQPVANPSNQPSRQPSSQPTGQPTQQPSLQPSSQPSIQPTGQPTQQPSSQPSNQPSIQPSSQPLACPSRQPSSQPSVQPLVFPSTQPSNQPTKQPSVIPSTRPTSIPSSQPFVSPSLIPSLQPISFPSTQPSHVPTEQPSKQPSMQPSNQPSAKPSLQPSVTPSNMPTMQPSITPTAQPSVQPSSSPSTIPSMQPTTQPIISPSIQPTSQPSRSPSCQPSSIPSSKPSSQPSRQPTTLPSLQPTSQPSGSPSSLPSNQPRCNPTHQPTVQPSVQPSLQPISSPTAQPSMHPSRQPSSQPSRQPISRPSRQPTSQPTGRPHSYPTSKPTSIPTELLLPLSPFESRKPSRIPTIRPTRLPTKMPTAFPSFIPTASPTESLPLHTELSVRFALNVTQKIRIVLPFLFTSVLETEALADVHIGTPLNGTSYVILGGKDLNYRIDVSSLLYFTPAYANDFSGRSVSNAGDVNGDGFDDLIIGVPYASLCYVLFGNENGFVNMTEGFTILGTKSSDLTGWSVSGAGDVNNDTFADIIIGAPGGGHIENSGAVYIIYGKGTTFVLIDLSNLSPLDGYAIHGVAAWEYLGISVSNAGDVNDDGFDDVIVGALRLMDAFSGAMYIVFGHKNNQSVSQHLETMLTVDSIEVKGSANSWFGYSVDAAGDVNGDGFADVIVGSIPHKMSFNAPVSYLIYGYRNMSVSSVSSMTASQGVVITGGGVVVSGVGDLDGDGFDDVLIGSGFRFDSGGGFIVNFPTSLSSVQTHAPIPIPSIPPSRFPSVSPSTMPSIAPNWKPTIRPTAPTVVPTMTPSGPTTLPSMTPTQPTSFPSALPSAPSLSPTMLPTVEPSASPTLSPSELPSVLPSASPSAMPSVEWSYRPTTTAVPSLAPTELWMLNPTRHPVVRPTLSPTTIAPSRAPTVFSTIIEVSLHSGFTNRTQIGIIYIVNATSNVRFQSGRGNDTFLVMPNTHSVITIEQFHVSDLIDLRMFSEYSKLNDLNITEIQRDRVEDTRRFLMLASTNMASQVDVLITLRQNQVIWLLNQRIADLNLANFIFAESFTTKKKRKEIEKIYNNIIAIGSGSFVSAVLLLFLCWKLYHCWQSEDKVLKLRNKVVSWQEELQSNGTFVTIYHQDFSLQSMDIESDGSSSTGSGTLSKKQSQSRSQRMDYDIVGMEIVYPTLDNGHGHGGHSDGNSSNSSSLSTRRDSVGSHASNVSKLGNKDSEYCNALQSSVLTRQNSFALYASNNVPCEVYEDTEYSDHCDLLKNSLPSPLPTTQHDIFLMYNEPHGDIERQGQHIENSLTRQNSFTLYVDSKIPQELNEDIDYRSNNNNIIPQDGFDEEMFQNITNIFQTSQEYGQNRHQYSSTQDVTVTNAKSINSLHLPKPRFRLRNVRQAIQAYEWYAIETYQQQCEEDADSNSSQETV